MPSLEHHDAIPVRDAMPMKRTALGHEPAVPRIVADAFRSAFADGRADRDEIGVARFTLPPAKSLSCRLLTSNVVRRGRRSASPRSKPATFCDSVVTRVRALSCQRPSKVSGLAIKQELCSPLVRRYKKA